MNIVEKINNVREMTLEELKESHRKINVENENLIITNELLIDNIKKLRQEKIELEIKYNHLLKTYNDFKDEKEKKNFEKKRDKLFNDK